jgi:flagellar motor protein MotB
MAKGGGGSWKVAYADFVTAMMAFFLVMWIGAQDQKVRQSVANYFVDPSGVTKKPAQTGATFDSIVYGPLPANEKVDMGKGRQPYEQPKPGDPSPATQLVNRWLRADPARYKYWLDQAQRCREAAAAIAPDGAALLEVAAQSLSAQLRAEVTAGLPTQARGVYEDLLFASLNEVNWTQLAQDLLTV